jgi:hypothetical protein
MLLLPRSTRDSLEQKYPHPRMDSNTTPLRDSFGSVNSSNADVGDLLRRSHALRDSIHSDADFSASREDMRSAAHPSLGMQFSVPYATSVTQAQRAIAAPLAGSRPVLVGHNSPPLTDISRLVRESIDSIDMGASSDNIGGLFGMDAQRPMSSHSASGYPPPTSAGGASTSRDLLEGGPDDVLSDYSFNSPANKMTSTELWIQSLR